MRKLILLLLLSGFASPALAAKPMSIEQMEQLLVELRGNPDGRVAAELENIQLTERVTRSRLMRWQAEFPGKREQLQLMKMADLSAFLDPPASDVVRNPRPDVNTQLHMLRMTVEYVANTIPRLPDFYATRETTHFENYSSAPSLSVGIVSTVLHSTGVYSRMVTYRDRHEVPFEGVGKQKKDPASGLTTDGEFGPILIGIVGDALRGKVEWLRWEQGTNGPIAIFSFSVPQADSHFKLGVTVGGKAQETFPAYHGEFAVDAKTGAIVRLSQIADTASPNKEQRAAILLEYAPVTISGRSYICPVRGVAFSMIPFKSASADIAPSNIGGVPTYGTGDQIPGPMQIRLNDVAFTHYHEFRTEARIVANGSENDTNAADDGAVPGSMAPAGAAPEPTSEPAVNVPASSTAPATEETATPASPSTPTQAARAATVPIANPSPPSTAETADAGVPVSPAGATNDGTEGPQPTGTVLHAKSNLVLVDVAVTDHDRPVEGLDRSRFRIFQDGREQAISSFEEIEPANATEDSAVVQPPALPPNTYSNVPAYPKAAAVNVLLMDALNTPTSDQEQLRRAMVKYLGTIRPGAELAIFTLSSQLRMAAGFTTDLMRLTKVLQSEKPDMRGASSVGSNPSSDLSQMATGLASTGDDPGTRALVLLIEGFEADTRTYDTQARTLITLNALSRLAQYLAAIPGKKNLIWFSGSFPPVLDPRLTNGAAVGQDASIQHVSDYGDAQQRTNALLAAARVAVYPVDARGILPAPTAGINYSPVQAVVDGSANNAGGGSVGPSGAHDIASFGQETALDRAKMDTIAEQTGGRVYSTGNDVAAAVDRVLANDSSYYTLSYVPPEEKNGKNGEFHQIGVKVDGGKYQLAYRRAYYADDTSKPASNSSGMPQPMTEAAVLGTPPSTQILFQARVLPAADPQLKGVTLDNGPAGDKSASLKGGAHRYVVDLSVNPAGLTFTEGADGANREQLDSALVAYDVAGNVVNSLGRALAFNLSPQQLERLQASGGTLPLQLQLDLPAGELAIRIVVYDPASARTGSLEVPVQVPGK
ncbi:MAG TPA: VWA domain-containing protein [Terracidiphilus sp.]|jgi:VWFA-related protein